MTMTDCLHANKKAVVNESPYNNNPMENISYHPNFVKYISGEISELPKERYNNTNNSATTTESIDPQIQVDAVPKDVTIVEPTVTAVGGIVDIIQKKESPLIHRDTLDGMWILDKSRGEWSMKHCLEVMNINPMIIDSHCIGELDNDSIQTIQFDKEKHSVRIIKKNYIGNDDIVIDLQLDIEHIEYLPPGNREKRTIAIVDTRNTSSSYCNLEIKSNLHTFNGYISIIDSEYVVQERISDNDNNITRSVLVQEMTITNARTKKQHKTTRYFNPI